MRCPRFFLLSLLAACADHGALVRLDVPIEGDPQTMVVIVERDTGETSLTVLDLGADPSAYLAERPYDGVPRRVSALLYDGDDPRALLLPFSQTLTLDGTGCRPLPAADTVWSSDVMGAEHSAWKEIDAGELDHIRLPAPDYDGCLAIGCVKLTPRADVTSCLPPDARCVPCEPPELEPTDPPVPPDPPRFTGEVPHPPGRENCGPGEVQFIDQMDCEVFDATCPSGEYHDNLPTDRGLIAYVKPGPPGGDGSMLAPYGSMLEAIGEGARVIALGEGVFDGGAQLSGVVVIGACSARTIIRYPAGNAILAGAGETEVRHVTLRDSAGGVFVQPGGSLVLENVWIEGATGDAIHVSSGGIASATKIVVRGSSLNGAGVDAGGELHVRDSVFEAHTGNGIFGFGRVSVTRTVFRENGENGIVMLDGALTSTHSDFALNGASGITVFGATLVLEDSVIRETRDPNSNALQIDRGAHADVARVAVLSNASAGVVIRSSTASARFEDLTVAGGGKDCLFVEQGASARLSRTYLESPRGSGIVVTTRASVDLADTIIIGAGRSGESIGVGILVAEGATLTSTRASITDTQGTALFVRDGGVALVNDLIARDTRVVVGGPESAVIIEAGGTVELHRGLIAGAQRVGFAFAPGSMGKVFDLEVTDAGAPAAIHLVSRTEPNLELDRVRVARVSHRALEVRESVARVSSFTFIDPGSGEKDSAIDVVNNSRFSLSRARIEDTRGHAIAVSRLSEADLSDVQIRRAGRSGLLAKAQDGTSLIRAHAMDIEDCALAGAYLESGGFILLDNSSITSTGTACSAGTMDASRPIFHFFDRVKFEHDGRPAFVRCLAPE